MPALSTSKMSSSRDQSDKEVETEVCWLVAVGIGREACEREATRERPQPVVKATLAPQFRSEGLYKNVDLVSWRPHKYRTDNMSRR